MKVGGGGGGITGARGSTRSEEINTTAYGRQDRLGERQPAPWWGVGSTTGGQTGLPVPLTGRNSHRHQRQRRQSLVDRMPLVQATVGTPSVRSFAAYNGYLRNADADCSSS